MKTVEELTREVEKLTGQMTAATSQITELTARAEKAEGDLKTEREAHTATKADLVKATDEVITVGGEEIRKSLYGEQNFKLAKALADERDMARLEKRAEAEFAHLPGTVAERAGVLKMIDRLPEAERAAPIAILTAAEKMAAGAFVQLGHQSAQTPTAKAATDQFEDKVTEIAKRDDLSRVDAMEKARVEHADLFAQMQGYETPAAVN